MSKRLLLVGIDENLQAVSNAALEGEEPWVLDTCDAAGPALDLIALNPPDAVLYDDHLEKYPFCEFARKVQEKVADTSIAIIIAGDDVDEAEMAELDNVWSFPSPIIPEILITILNMASKKPNEESTEEEVEGVIGSVFGSSSPPRREYAPIEGIEVQTLYGEDEDGIALEDASQEAQEIDVVEVDDSSEFIGVSDDDGLESVDILEEPAEEEPAEESAVEEESVLVETYADDDELEVVEVLEGDTSDMEELEMVEILELSDDDELEFAEAEPLDDEPLETEPLEIEPLNFDSAETDAADDTVEAEMEESIEEPEAEHELTAVEEVEFSEDFEDDGFAADGFAADALEAVEEPVAVEAEEPVESVELIDDDDEAESEPVAFVELEEGDEEFVIQRPAEAAATHTEEEFSFDELELGLEGAETSSDDDDIETVIDDDFSFDEVEAGEGMQTGEADPLANEEDFSFDEVETDIGVTAASAPLSPEEDFSFDEAEELSGAAVETVAPAAARALEGIVGEGMAPEKLEAIIRETVERVVWEVVPPLAEKMIGEAIEKLKEPQ